VRKPFANQRAHDERRSFTESLLSLYEAPQCRERSAPLKTRGSAHGNEVRANILAFFAAHHEEHGTWPTIREVGAAVGLSSSSSVASHLSLLVKQGRLAHVVGKPRTYRLVNYRGPAWLVSLSEALDAIASSVEALNRGAAADPSPLVQRAQELVGEQLRRCA